MAAVQVVRLAPSPLAFPVLVTRNLLALNESLVPLSEKAGLVFRSPSTQLECYLGWPVACLARKQGRLVGMR